MLDNLLGIPSLEEYCFIRAAQAEEYLLVSEDL